MFRLLKLNEMVKDKELAKSFIHNLLTDIHKIIILKHILSITKCIIPYLLLPLNLIIELKKL